MSDCVICNRCGKVCKGRPAPEDGWYALTPTKMGQKKKEPTTHLCPYCYQLYTTQFDRN